MIAEPLVELESVSKDYQVGRASVHALGDVTHDPAPLPGDSWAPPSSD